MVESRRKKKKICHMCAGHPVDYKNVEIISKYVGSDGRILPRRITGTCARHQREVSKQVKYARFVGFLPFVK